jgi:hypothetical protein
MFAYSRQHYDAGWTTHDRVADPKFVRVDERRIDVRLQKDSPAINAGQSLSDEWPDPLRDADEGLPDSGALPLGAEEPRIGINGRLSLFGG